MIKLKRPIFISVGKNLLMDVIFSNIVTGADYKFYCALLRLEPENPIYEYQPVRMPRVGPEEIAKSSACADRPPEGAARRSRLSRIFPPTQ